jgi:predicted dehydrogenase
VCRALSAGKCVFVEKPLATDESQLARVADAYGAARGRLMVGFNRRFAPLAREAKGVIGDAPRDLVVVCRVNAGFLAPDHWVRDEEEGCGRIIGEVCHFVDLVQHLAGAPLVRVFAERTAGEPDNVCATLALATGAIGTIVYTASGSRGFPRERVEAFTERSVCVIDDFRRGRFAANDRRWRRGGMSVDRGHRNELEAFVGCLRSGDAFPVPLADYVNTTRATFAIEESLREGQPALVEP